MQDVKSQSARRISADRFVTVLLSGAIMVCFCGCPPPIETEPEIICPGKATAAEVIETLRQKPPVTLSLKAAADCTMEYTDGEGTLKSERFDGQLRLAGANNLYLAGDKFGKILLGANTAEFWMYVKPGIDTAWYGLRERVARCPEKIGFNPFYLTEALGQIDLTLAWSLTSDVGIDKLTVTEDAGIKHVYLNCCTWRVERIEYCNLMGQMIASADLSGYKNIEGVGEIPTVIDLRHFRSRVMDTRLLLKLSQAAVFVPTEKQNQLFVRPPARGFEHMYLLNENCDFVAAQDAIEGRL